VLHQPLTNHLSRKIPLHYQIVNMDSLSYLREISVYLLQPPSPSITLPPRDFQAPLLISQLQVNTAKKPSGTQSPFCNHTREEATPLLSYEDLETTARIRIVQKSRMFFWQLSVNTGSGEKCI
jgi:hypothetical protein